jgi:acyl-[acyl-carrier-protein]-phospholipid O-acyltransferase/long-chain-fatty-acid--[acyl-carrier-protein] ligase
LPNSMAFRKRSFTTAVWKANSMILHRNFVRAARKHGSKAALVDRTAGREITYSEALIASLALAGKFEDFEKGHIGIMIPTSAGCCLSVLGTLMSGRIPVMINYSTGAARNAEYAQRKCGFRTIVTSRALLEKTDCPVVEGMVFIEDIVASISPADKLKAAVISRLPMSFMFRNVHAGEEDVAVILFTSGSEKDPKAVQLTHRNISSNIGSFSDMVGLSGNDRILANLPLFHVFGLTVTMWTPLYHGMTIVTCANPLDYRMVCTIAREEAPTIMVGTPSFLRGYLWKSEPGDFGSLRLVVCGADRCPEALRKEFARRHGITVYEGYGTTETSPVISVNTPEHNRPGSIGKILPGVKVRIENQETGENCLSGETGRIMVKGDLVMKGYFGDVEETSMRIRHGWYDTGDMGFLDEEGFLWHSGRLKRFVKIGGEMVSLVMVESVMEAFLPEGVSCCVVEAFDALKGSRIVAAVTQKIDEKEILRQMAVCLPNIALPKMGSGKIDFRAVTGMVNDLA